ncbi:MAG: aspartate-semialdehyde dehydrogenase [Clostridiales bacterium]|nr:aspartate-semialdehyde dehydrogenase [Clostridiales bacterium]
MRKVNLAIVGATGMVGEKLVEIVQSRNLPCADVYFYSSGRSAGTKLQFRGETHVVEELTQASFDRPIDIALFSAGGAVSGHYAPILAARGGVAIDNSSRFRMDPAVPLIVPEVNPWDVFKHKGIIANPNCSTIQAVVALSPLHRALGIRRIIYNTYQAVSGAGMAGVKDLQDGLRGRPPQKFPHPIADNVLPQVDKFTENGYTAEEMKMINETRKILGAPGMKISATCVRVPVFNGHSESINVEFENIFEIEDIEKILSDAPGVVLQNGAGQYPMAITASGTDHVYVGRIRRDEGANAINMWVAADNLRKGAATNTVQIAELLLQRGI